MSKQITITVPTFKLPKVKMPKLPKSKASKEREEMRKQITALKGEITKLKNKASQ